MFTPRIQLLLSGLLCLGVILSGTAFVLFNRPSERGTHNNWVMPTTDRAIVIDPATRAVTLEAIDSE